MNVDISAQTQATIRAERLTLRPVRMSDAGLLEHFASDIRVASFTRSIPHPYPPGAADAFIRRAQALDRTEDIWVMDGTDAGLGEVVGVIGLERMDNPARRQVEVGFYVAPGLWNSGLASEAVGALMAANPLEADTVFAEVFQDNPGSARVLTNAGFEYLGDAEAFSVARNAKVQTWTYLKKLA